MSSDWQIGASNRVKYTERLTEHDIADHLDFLTIVRLALLDCSYKVAV